jgi:hypothetical protein
VQNSFIYGDTVSFTRGRHSFRFGGEYRRHQMNGNLQEDKHGRIRPDSWFQFLTVGFKDPADRNRARQINDIILNYGQTIRGYRMSDANLFLAHDWKVSSNFTLNLGVRWEYFGFPYEVNGMLSSMDYPAALASGKAADGFLFASNFNPESVPGATEQEIRYADSRSIQEGDFNNIMPRFGFAWSPGGNKAFVVRGGYGMFYERISGGFANSLRMSAPFMREAQYSDLGNYNQWPSDVAAMPFPAFSIGFDDGDPQLEGSNAPGQEFEAFETQNIDPKLATPYMQQWSLNLQWEFTKDWLFEIGYTGSKGTKLLQIANANMGVDVDTIGFLPRPGVPGGGFIGNYYDIVDDEFVSQKAPPSWCDTSDDPGDCTVGAELRAPVLGFDEDEGVNTLYSNANSNYHSLQTSLQKRFSMGHMFNINYTFSRSIDTFSDESDYQIQNDQRRPYLNRGLSDFHRKHRLVFSGTWELPFKGSRWIDGWSVSGIGTFQSGTPFTVIDDDFSAFLFETSDPRPILVGTHEDQTTNGPVNERVDNYLNGSAFESSGPYFGNLGRNTVMGPDQRRIDLVVSKLTRVTEKTSLEFRAEFFNAFNTVAFRNPENDMSEASFGEIEATRGGPRVIQFGLKLRF